jgi:hypothetical protein
MIKKITTEIFVQRFKQKYPDSNYLLDRIKYKTSREKIEVGCEHGYWFISPNCFMDGQCSCKECFKIKKEDNFRKNNKFNNLLNTNSKLCLEWHTTKNADKNPENYTFGSEQKIWWKCVKDYSHEWEAVIKNRAGKNNAIKSGCPFCNGKANAKNNLTTTNSNLVLEWNEIKNGDKKPENYTFGSHEKIWWKCVKDHFHEWEASISNRAGKNNTIKDGCPFCDGKVNAKNNLTITNPELCLEWHSTKNSDRKPENYTFGSHEKIWWQCIEDNSRQ